MDFEQLLVIGMVEGHMVGGEGSLGDGGPRKNTRSFYNGPWWRVRRDLGFKEQASMGWFSSLSRRRQGTGSMRS